MPVFDTTIDRINKVANELASPLAEEAEVSPDAGATPHRDSSVTSRKTVYS